jgi:hypothetical protein
MKTPQEFQTFNRYGQPLRVITGVLQEMYGTFIFCKGGLVIQAADIKVPEENEVRTVYLEIAERR